MGVAVVDEGASDGGGDGGEDGGGEWEVLSARMRELRRVCRRSGCR